MWPRLEPGSLCTPPSSSPSRSPPAVNPSLIILFTGSLIAPRPQAAQLKSFKLATGKQFVAYLLPQGAPPPDG